MKRRYSLPQFYACYYLDDSWKIAGFYTGFNKDEAISKAKEDLIGNQKVKRNQKVKIIARRIKTPSAAAIIKATQPK